MEANGEDTIFQNISRAVHHSTFFVLGHLNSVKNIGVEKSVQAFFRLKGFYSLLLEKFTLSLQSFFRLFFFTTKISLYSFLLTIVFTFLIFVGLIVLGILSTTSAASVRYLWVKDIPGNGVVRLSFNVLPLVTEWWRSTAIDSALQYYLPPPECQAEIEDGKGEKGERKHLEMRKPNIFTEREKTGFPNREYVAGVSSTIITQASQVKISLVQQYVNAMVATSTLLIPSKNRLSLHRSMARMGFPSLFSSSGKVNPDLLFKPPVDPFFTLDAEYSGSIQLVFLKEDVGADSVLVVDFSILYADMGEGGGEVVGGKPASLEDEDEWLLPHLRVLFGDTQTVHIQTGPPARSRLKRWLYKGVEKFFFFPLLACRYLYYFALDYENGPFPFIDSSKEVAVVIPLYKRFIPPSPIRDRLRAINFTIYQAQSSQEEKKVRLSRWMFHSSIQLQGVAYYFREYPFISFLLLCVFFSGVYFFGFVTLLLLVGWKCWRGEEKEEEQAGGNRWRGGGTSLPARYNKDHRSAKEEVEEDAVLRSRTPHTDSSFSSSRSSRSDSHSRFLLSPPSHYLGRPSRDYDSAREVPSGLDTTHRSVRRRKGKEEERIRSNRERCPIKEESEEKKSR